MRFTSHNVSYTERISPTPADTSQNIIYARSLLAAMVQQATPSQISSLMAALGFVWDDQQGLWVADKIRIIGPEAA